MRSPRRHGHSTGVVFAVVAVVLVVLVAAGAALVLYGRRQLEAPAATHDRVVTVDVAEGETLDQLTSDLAAHGLVRSEFFFGWFARFKGLADHLHPGRYRLDTGMGASAVVARLEEAPDVATRRVVLAEGLTAEQMATKVEAAGIGVTAQQYMTEVRSGTFDEPFLRSRPAGASLEGFLFPDTYEVPVTGVTAHAFVQMQLDDFAGRASSVLGSPPHGLTPYQLVVVASIIEREARFPEDRPLVASVIYNRLAQGMPLQVDATVNYGNGVVDRAPTQDELQRDTPYNTYLHTGLPPTPIANPGTSTLQAAAAPAATPYLFYVSDGCGHNHYSTTAAQHDALVRQYLGQSCG